MFNDLINAGKHLICDFKDIKNLDLLINLDKLKQLCKHICEMHNFIILGELSHSFHPEGISFVFLLSESHMSLHTFPEKQFISFDLYSCRQYENNDDYIKIYKTMVENLKASERSSLQIIERTF
jgi:S-adenosylmethionine decarboxylase proenzyme